MGLRLRFGRLSGFELRDSPGCWKTVCRQDCPAELSGRPAVRAIPAVRLFKTGKPRESGSAVCREPENSLRKFSARQLMFPRCFAEGFLIVIKRSAPRREKSLFSMFFFFFLLCAAVLCQVYCSLGKYRRSQCRQNRIKQSASKHDICLRI